MPNWAAYILLLQLKIDETLKKFSLVKLECFTPIEGQQS